MIATKDIAWLAGLVEGEGCISWNAGGVRKYGTPQIQIASTDRDVIVDAARLFGQPVRGPYKKGLKKNGEPNKDAWLTSVGGAKAAGWMMTLYPLLHERRRAKAKEVLGKWKAYRNGPTRGKYSTRCIRGHEYDGFSHGQRTCSACARARYHEKALLSKGRV